MRKGNIIIKALAVAALLICTLALAGIAMAEGITVVEYTLYDDGSSVSVSYALEKGDGYVLKDYMTLKSFSFVMDPTGGPESMTDEEIIDAWEAGMREWNRHLATPLFTMNNTVGTVDIDPNTSKGTYDGKNTLSFDDLSSGVLAVTKAYLSTTPLPEGYPAAKRVVEADIIFDIDVDWVDVAKGGTGHDLCSIATHELGHTLGLGDVTDGAYSYVTMYGYGLSDDISARTLAEPDLIGLSKLYDVPGYGAPVLPTPTPEPTPGMTATVNTTSSGLNMRAEPSATGTLVTTMPRGASVAVLEKGATWSKVSYGGYTGYAMNAYLAFNDPAATATPTPQPTAAPEVPQIQTARVIASSALNMRSIPSTSGTVLTRIPSGATVSVISYAADWSQVKYNGYTGYVSSQYIALTAAPTAAPTTAPTGAPTATAPAATGAPTTAPTATAAPTSAPGGATRTVTLGSASQLNMREGAGTGYLVIGFVPNGAQVTVLSEEGSWSRIQYGGITGYVMSAYLK